jgi:drug/metabolite transporter (DMT)-like permease
LTTLVAVIWLGERWSRRLGVGLLLSLGGVLMVISHGSWEALRTLSFHQGDLLLIGAVLCWSTYSTLGKVVMSGLSPLLVTTVTTLVGAGFLAVCAVVEGGLGRVAELSVQSWVEIVYMAVFATVVAFVLWNLGVHRIGATKTSAYVNLVPINAMWIAALFYGEQVAAAQVLGLLLVIGGVLVTTRSPQRGRPQEQVRGQEDSCVEKATFGRR